MSLHAQIGLMTVPQEFMRLCNAVLEAEYDDDFLPIDDDQADRGNDGYRKSEKQIFAAHCFKRVQNQSLSRVIREKMVGDLGKAIALKQAGMWDIEAWAFLSNYPVSDSVAADLVRLGNAAGISVSWRGPDYFAGALQRHPDIRDRFPDLQVNEVGERLAAIQEVVAGGDEARAPVPAGVPQTEDEQRALLLARPGGWEHLLFAGRLFLGKEKLAMKWRDHELEIPRGVHRRLDVDQATDYLSDEFGRLTVMVGSVMRVFDARAQEQAFGPPGVSGDAVKIEHAAELITSTYEGMLDWAAEIRGVVPPDVMQGVFEVAPHMADKPLKEMRTFIERAVTEMGKIPAHLKDPDGGQLIIDLELVLDVDENVQRELNRQTRRARRKLRWGF